jgi:hypothetical protein
MFARAAFSIFLVPPASASGHLASNTEEGRVQLKLEATEGKGISAAQAVATAKIHHSPILNTPALQDFLSNKLHVNVLVFGRFSPLTTFLRTWSRHTVSHRESYELLTNVDPSFYSRVGHIIDMAKQAFLCSCITASMTLDIDQSVLDHASLRTGISMGMMPAVAIPASLASILPSSAPRSCPLETSNNESPSKGAKATKQIAKDKPKARDPPRKKQTPTKSSLTCRAGPIQPASKTLLTDEFFAVSGITPEDPRVSGNINNFSGRGLNIGLTAQNCAMASAFSLHH